MPRLFLLLPTILLLALLPMLDSVHIPEKAVEHGSGTTSSSGNGGKGLKVLLLIPCFHFNRSHVNFAIAIYRAIRQEHKVHVIMPYAHEEHIQFLRDDMKKDKQLAEDLEFFDLKHSDLVVEVDEKVKDENGVPTGEKKKTKKRLGEAIQDNSFSYLMSMFPTIWKVLLDLKYGIKDNVPAPTIRRKEDQYDVGIAEFSQPNQYAFAVFHALGIKHRIVTRAYSPNGQNYTGLGLLQAAIKGHIPPVDKTELSDIFLNNVHGNPEEKLKLQERYEQIENDYKMGNERATKGIGKCDKEFKKMPGFEDFQLLKEFERADFYFSNTQPELEFDDGAVLSIPVEKRPPPPQILGSEDAGHSAAFYWPEVAMVGGVHVQEKEQEPLDKTIELKMAALTKKWSSLEGIVLISFGSVLRTEENLTHVHFEAMLAVVRQRLNVLFIWQLSEGDDRIAKLNGEENVFSASWVDQPAILAHPQTLAFVSHCGRNSQYEATFFGIALVCVPIFMDQFYNAVVTARKQRGVFLDFFCLELKNEQYQLDFTKYNGNPVLTTKETLKIKYNDETKLHSQFLATMTSSLKKWEQKEEGKGKKSPFQKRTHPSKDCFTKKNFGTALEEAIGTKNHYERHRGGPDDKKSLPSIDGSKLIEAKANIRAHPAKQLALKAMEKIMKKKGAAKEMEED